MAAAKSSPKPLDRRKLQSWFAHRQGLDGALAKSSPAELLENTGWMRSLGGAGPYLGFFARVGLDRQNADKSVSKLEMHELPSARGCGYVIPKADFALALAAGQSFEQSEMNVAYKLGVTDKEIAKLCDAVLTALASGPLDPDQIRDATGKASRSLGDAGKKKGLTTTLPLAIGRLQSLGEIRKVPVNGRLDEQRFQYTLWRPNPLAKFRLTAPEIQTELARRYFRWSAPATLAEFQWFSGLGVGAAKKAVEPLQLIEGGSDRLIPPDLASEFAGFRPSQQPRYSLVSRLDGMFLLRREISSLLDPSDASRPVYAGKGLAALGSLTDLPSHAILDRGRLIGLWEFDPAEKRIVWASFIPKNRDLEQAVKRTEAFVRDQLGDARAGLMDTPASRKPRLSALAQG